MQFSPFLLYAETMLKLDFSRPPYVCQSGTNQCAFSYFTLIFILTCNTVSVMAPHGVGSFRNSLLMADCKAFRDMSGPSIKGSSSMLWVKSVFLLLCDTQEIVHKRLVTRLCFIQYKSQKKVQKNQINVYECTMTVSSFHVEQLSVQKRPRELHYCLCSLRVVMIH